MKGVLLCLFLLVSKVYSSEIHTMPKPVFNNNKITHLENGEELTKARRELISQATHSIYLSTFSISTDEIGSETAELLCQKAKEGLEVRLIIDHRANKDFYSKSVHLKECGAYVISFRPGDRLFAIHEKLLIVDGIKVIMGGSGYTRTYKIASPDSHDKERQQKLKYKRGWYDSDYLIEGLAACSYHYQYRWNFEWLAKNWADYNPDMWWYGEDNFRQMIPKIYGLKKFGGCLKSEVQGDENIIPILANPYKKSQRPILEAHLHAISLLKDGDEALLYAPYFVPNPKVVKALAEAAKRGAHIKVITNSIDSTDEGYFARILFVAMVHMIKPMLDQGVEVYLWKEHSTIHRKGGVIGKLAFFGSDNLDNRAQNYQSESVAYTDSAKIVEGVKKDYERDLKNVEILTDEIIKKVFKGATRFQKFVGKNFKKYF